MKIFFLLLIVTVYSISVNGQTFISGKVVDSTTGEPLSGLNVIFAPLKGSGIYGFVITDENGIYNYKHSIKADSVNITVAGAFIKKTSKIVAINTAPVDFKVVQESLKINEVVVKATPIKRSGDTLNYYVSSYIDTLQDRVIGDVLRKMPGIDITRGGQIYYNNRPINKFYIEGLELLGGRYGIAVKNVRAKDISRVEIFENHQPIKALKDIELSQDAAINLHLKEGSKGSIIASILLGGGFKPFLWNNEITLMHFANKHQTIATYKSNNSGDDIRLEINSYYDQIFKEKSMMSIHLPNRPKTDQERYMDNITHAVSLNHIIKLSKNDNNSNTLNMNFIYLHDKQKYSSESNTTYYLPNTYKPLNIGETISATELTDNIEAKMRYNINNENLFLNEQITFRAEWANDHGTVLNSNQTINQKFKRPDLKLQNNFNLVKVFKKNMHINYSSIINVSSAPANLYVSPIIFPEFFNYKQDTQSAIQDVHNNKFHFKNNIFFNRSYNCGIKLFISTGFTADLQRMESKLFTTSPNDTNIADSLQNNMDYKKFDLPIGAKISYTHKSVNISGNFGTTYANTYINDKIKLSDKKHNKLLINSNIQIDIDLNPNLKFFTSGTINDYFGSLDNIYNGYIMTDYRIISNSNGDIAKYRLHDYYVMLNYSNALMSLFGSIKASYRQNHSNIMYGTDYIGTLSHIETYNINNTADMWNIESKIEKRFDNISTTIGIPFTISSSSTNILRQKKIMKSYSNKFSTGLEINSNITDNFSLDYTANYTHNHNKIINYDNQLKTINTFHQDFMINFAFLKNVIFNVRGEHYMNSAIVSGSKNIFFLDSSVSVKTKKIDYIITGKNLLNNTIYNQYVYSDIATYQYNYKLRPISIMFKIRFNIG